MLVLTRKAEQKIQIGPDVVITILDVKGRYVRIGIEAPSEVRILRGELNTPQRAEEQAPSDPREGGRTPRAEPPGAPHVIAHSDVPHVPLARPHH